MNWRWISARGLLAVLLVLILGVGGCGGGSGPRADGQSARSSARLAGPISEVSPPATLQELRQALDRYQPQVDILSPRPDQVLSDNRVTVEFQVQNLPLFQNEAFGLGPHLHVILDNEPYQAVYDANQPLVLEDVSPGTHTLRVFASRPWHESFKNEGAYAQTTFHVFTQTADNHPDQSQPLLTYSRPKGSYGAEPVLLDFYLTNAPLHLIAQERTDDNIVDWQIRCTVNGESFIFDRWQPIYLKGLKPGQNWVKLELLDENGNLFPNAYNSTVRLITYEPNGSDTLSKLVRGELSAADVRGIVEPNYQPQPAPVFVPKPAPTVTPEAPELEIEEEAPAIAPIFPAPAPTDSDFPDSDLPNAEGMPPPESPAAIEALPEISQPQAPKSGGFFDRFRRGKDSVTTPAPTPVLPSEEPLETPEVEILPESQPDTDLVAPAEPELLEPEDAEIAPPPLAEPPKSRNFLERFRRQKAEPEPALPAPETLPEVLDEPSVDSALESLPGLETPNVQEPLAEPVFPSDSVPPDSAPAASAPVNSDLAPDELSPRLQEMLKRFQSSQNQGGDRPMTPEDTLPEIIEQQAF